MTNIMDDNEIHKKMNNIPKSREIRSYSSIEDTQTKDFDYCREVEETQSQTISAKLNIDSSLNNNNNDSNDIISNGIEHHVDSTKRNTDVNTNTNNTIDTKNDHNNNNNDVNNNSEQSKLKHKKHQLSPFAPEFNVAPSSSINPYGGVFGVKTRPAYVPPAQIPHIVSQQETTGSTNTINNTTTSHQPNIHSSKLHPTDNHYQHPQNHYQHQHQHQQQKHHNINGHVVMYKNINNSNNNGNNAMSPQNPEFHQSNFPHLQSQFSPNLLPQHAITTEKSASPQGSHKHIGDDISNGSDKSNDGHHYNYHPGANDNGNVNNGIHNNNTNLPHSNSHILPYMMSTEEGEGGSHGHRHGQKQDKIASMQHQFQQSSNKKY